MQNCSGTKRRPEALEPSSSRGADTQPRPVSGRFAIVVPQHAAQPDPADDLAVVPGQVVPDCWPILAQQSVAQFLVRPFPVEMFEVFCHQMVQVLQAKRDELVQALALQ